MDAPRALSALFIATSIGCGGATVEPPPGMDDRGLRDPSALPYGRELVAFDPGEGAGFGSDKLPEIVLGPPKGRGTNAGSTDVLSLGAGGTVVLGFSGAIVDQAGPDFVVFENAFFASGEPTVPFAELGAVAVSTDAQSWHELACDPAGAGPGRYPGCAGWNPVHLYDPFAAIPIAVETTGGDAFDLADFGVQSARYVRVRDLNGGGEAPTRGFDLDAIGVIHPGP